MMWLPIGVILAQVYIGFATGREVEFQVVVVTAALILVAVGTWFETWRYMSRKERSKR